MARIALFCGAVSLGVSLSVISASSCSALISAGWLPSKSTSVIPRRCAYLFCPGMGSSGTNEGGLRMRLEHWLYTIPLRIRSLFRRSKVEQELDEELPLHLEQLMAQQIAAGKTPDEA